jgi:hypothetical protein
VGTVAGRTQTTRESGLMSFTSREQEETLTGAGGAEEIRGIGSALYINANPVAIAPGGGAGWIVTYSGDATGSSLPFASELSTVGSDPGFLILVTAVSAVRRAGTSGSTGPWPPATWARSTSHPSQPRGGCPVVW